MKPADIQRNASLSLIFVICFINTRKWVCCLHEEFRRTPLRVVIVSIHRFPLQKLFHSRVEKKNQTWRINSKQDNFPDTLSGNNSLNQVFKKKVDIIVSARI